MRASITYTRYTIHESRERARAHLTHRRYAIRHGCNVRERAKDYKYGESATWGSPYIPAVQQPVFFCFPFFLFFFSFVFVLSSLNARMPFLVRGRGKEEGDSERAGERAGEDNARGIFN